jgi:ABC-type polysaccharide/polyol phosphate transport system ATPase subunit
LQSVSNGRSVKVEDVSVTYRTSYEKVPTLKTTLLRLGRRELLVREIEALKGVSFGVGHGTVLGIVGANGAGKSTLVRTVAGILPPNEGRVEVAGRISTLLALGVGFNRELSGRDNVVLGGLAAGLRREEVQERYDQIAAFAELDEFMDLPMRTYSSGMYSRLAFSVAVHMDPDVLLIDEALSAGDARFKRKSLDKMRELCAEARTILLVSHALATVRELCDEVIWMHAGELLLRDEPETVIKAYTRFLEVGETQVALEDL